MRQTYRKKVFVIPYNASNGDVMLVQDRKSREWGFVSGGVKSYESYRQAAQRELFEETSGFFSYSTNNSVLDRASTRVTHFQTDYRPEELLIENRRKGEQVQSYYQVFWVPITDAIVRRLETQFVPNDEIINLRVAPYYSFRNRWIVCDMLMNEQKDFSEKTKKQIPSSINNTVITKAAAPAWRRPLSRSNQAVSWRKKV